jgi:hemerythrin
MLCVKSLETGIIKIDDQHKQLFDKIDILLEKDNANRHKEVIDFLDKYIVMHFGDEQQMHKETNYPKAKKKKKFHEDFVPTYRSIRDKFVKEGPSLENNIAINKTLVGWLKDHIMKHDKEFSDYYKSLR